MKIGAPLGNATLGADRVWRRRFVHINVSYDTVAESGQVEWSGSEHRRVNLKTDDKSATVFTSRQLCIQLPPSADSQRGRAAAEDLLLSELRRRHQMHSPQDADQWLVAADCPATTPVISLNVVGSGPVVETEGCATMAGGSETFVLCRVAHNELRVVGRSDRGLMLGVGRLLRELTVSASGALSLPSGELNLSITPPPFGQIRGHQLTDWGFYMTTPAFEQFVKDLLVFGTNQVEFAHMDWTRGDQHKLVQWSTILDKYDLRVSLFGPPFSTAADQAITLEVFANMTRVDSFFQEGPSAASFSALQKEVATLRKFHPNCTSWVSPCGLDEVSLQAWFSSLATATTKGWLTGVCYGPGVHISMEQMVQRLPSGYALRQYPDISHSLAAMYPQPNWHRAWAFSHGRLVVNPSPRRFSQIATMNQNSSYSERAIGFGAYSEGASDDLNKMLWSAFYLEPTTTVAQFVQQYARHFLSNDTASSSQLLSSLERNWDGDALGNTHVNTSLALARQLDVSPLPVNWRLQAYLFRAYFDAYVQARLQHEIQVESDTRVSIARAARTSDGSVTVAEKLLARPWHGTAARVAKGWKLRAFELAEAINVSLGGGGHWGGMAVLQSQDPTLGLVTIDTPLSEKAHLRAVLKAVSALATVSEKKAGLLAVEGWTDPGAGGFYDQLGVVPRSPRLSSGLGPEADPQFLYAPLVSYDEGGAEEALLTQSTERISWFSYAQAYWNASVSLSYGGLDKEASYRVRLVYVMGGDAGKSTFRLTATGGDGVTALVHAPLAVNATAAFEFAVPQSATRGGQVQLDCHGPQGVGGMGRCCQIAEVWLLMVPPLQSKVSLKTTDEGVAAVTMEPAQATGDRSAAAVCSAIRTAVACEPIVIASFPAEAVLPPGVNPWNASAYVWAEVEGGSGESVRVGGYFANGSVSFRFTPLAAGRYTVALHRRNSLPAPPPCSFVAAASPKPNCGFVKVGKNQQHFAVSEQESWVGIGENLAWVTPVSGWNSHGVPQWSNRFQDWKPFLTNLSAHGANYIRVWLTDSAWDDMAVETQLGNYSLANTERIEDLLILSHELNIKVLMTIESFNYLCVCKQRKQGGGCTSPCYFDHFVYNAAHPGGFLHSPDEFFNSSRADDFFQMRLRYLVARYSAFPSVFAFEFFNEVDITDKFSAATQAAWFSRMASYVRSIDGFRHPISTSFGSGRLYPEVWQLPSASFSMMHSYGASNPLDAADDIQYWSNRLSKAYGKPTFVAEFGTGPAGTGEAEKQDLTGISLHNGLWASIVSMSAIGASTWFWDSWVQDDGLYSQFEAASKFVATVQWQDFHWNALGNDIKECKDVTPGGNYTCAQQKSFGQCKTSNHWMVGRCCQTCWNCSESCTGPPVHRGVMLAPHVRLLGMVGQALQAAVAYQRSDVQPVTTMIALLWFQNTNNSWYKQRDSLAAAEKAPLEKVISSLRGRVVLPTAIGGGTFQVTYVNTTTGEETQGEQVVCIQGGGAQCVLRDVPEFTTDVAVKLHRGSPRSSRGNTDERPSLKADDTVRQPSPEPTPELPRPAQPSSPVLREQLAECAKLLQDPSFEQATLLVSKLFEGAISSDAGNEHAIAESYRAFRVSEFGGQPNVTAEDSAAARALPGLEAAASAASLQRALATCLALTRGKDRAASRPPTRALTPQRALLLPAGSSYFRAGADDRAYFPFGWNQGPAINGTLNSQLKSELRCSEVMPARLFVDDLEQPERRQFNKWGINETVVNIKATVDSGLQPILFLGHGRAPSKNAPTSHAMPAWALHEYPRLAEDAGNTHFCSYDIDNPGAKDVWNFTLAAVLPAVFAAAMPPSTAPRQLLVSLHNEPGWYSANSSHTLRKFVAFLQARYGSVHALNKAWGDKLTSWVEFSVTRMRAVAWLSPVQHLDWGRFNNERVTAWFLWLCETAKRSAGPNAGRIKCLVKASNGASPLGFTHTDGIDRVQLPAGLDLNGCDTRAEFAVGQSHQPFSQLPTSTTEAYAMDWVGMMGSYDFMASMAPGKPVVDYEWHAVSTVHFRQQDIPVRYLRTALWLAHVHGLSGNQVWMWGRDGWTGAAKISPEFGGADFVMSVWAQPQLVDAYVRTSLELNSLSELVVGLASGPRKIFLLYSPSAAIMGDTLYLEMQLATYSLAAQLGVNIGFATSASQLVAAGGNTTCSPDSPCALLVPCMTSIAPEVVAELKSGISGVYAITVGNASVCNNAFQYDDHGGTLEPAAKSTMLGLQTIELGHIAGKAAMRLLESKLMQSLNERLVICTDNTTASSQHNDPRPAALYGTHCRSAMVGSRIAVIVTNLLNHSVSVSLVHGDMEADSTLNELMFAENNTELDGKKALILGSLETLPLWAAPAADHVEYLSAVPISERGKVGGTSEARNCRDRFHQPFAADSPWNMAIGDEAVYMPGDIFAKAAPIAFFNDHDYIITTTDTDPLTAVFAQGEWGATPAVYCTRKTTEKVMQIPFPRNATFTAFGENNAFAVLLPDKTTIIQSQPLYRCKPDAPILALGAPWLVQRHTGTPINVSIEAGGHATMLGPHGGSGLSAIGGTIRLGEMAPGGAIHHALKLELSAREYYHRVNATDCHRWPALPRDRCPEFKGTNEHIQPGSLLAVPPMLSAALETELSSAPALKLLGALTEYGGYLVDDTGHSNRGTFVAEPAVVDEVNRLYGFPLYWVFAPNNKTKAWCNVSKTPCRRSCCAAPPCGCNRTAHDEFFTDMLAVFQALHVVTNSGPDAIGGGGKRRRPPAAPLCPLKTGDNLPHVLWASEPVEPGQAVMVHGGNFGGGNVSILLTVAGNRSGDSHRVTPLQTSPSSTKFIMPTGMPPGLTYELTICANSSSDQTSLAFPLNVARVWWAQGDEGNSSTPGGWVRIFGQNMWRVGGQPPTLRLQTTSNLAADAAAPLQLEAIAANASAYSAQLMLPPVLRAGEYLASVRGGFGGNVWTPLRFFASPTHPRVTSVENAI
jgi:hypothetical protein